MDSLTLYDSPHWYDAALGKAEADEVEFYHRILTGDGATPSPFVLSMGCGTGRIESPLSGAGVRFAGFDASIAMTREAKHRDPQGFYVAARFEAPPFSKMQFDGAMSGLLSFAYLTNEKDARKTVAWTASVLRPHTPLVLELPVAYKPRKLQGIEESFAWEDGEYSFRYLDVERESPYFSVLHTVLSVEWRGRRAERCAPFAVYTPDGIRAMLTENRLYEMVRFFAPYDCATETEKPPADCLRAMVVARRTG